MDFQTSELSSSLKAIWHVIAYRGKIVKNSAGEIVNPVAWEFTKENMIVTAGKNLLLDRLAGTGGPPAAVTTIGAGDSATAAALGQTQLLGSSVLIQACDATFPSRAGSVTTWKSTFGTGVANFVWNELGLFNGLVNGTSIMLSRLVIGPFTKSASVSIVPTVTVTQS